MNRTSCLRASLSLLTVVSMLALAVAAVADRGGAYSMDCKAGPVTVPVAERPAAHWAGEEEGCGNNPVVLDADSLFVHIERYEGNYIETEGLIVHVCGVDMKKMMLRTDAGRIIRISPGGDRDEFGKELDGRRVRFRGIAREKRLGEEYVEEMESRKVVLCAVDHSPCIARDWIEKLEAGGMADSVSVESTERMRRLLEEYGKGYVPVVTVEAEWLEVAGSGDPLE